MVICPKCWTENADNAMNCKFCQINLAFAISHPEQFGLERTQEQKGEEVGKSKTDSYGSLK